MKRVIKASSLAGALKCYEIIQDLEMEQRYGDGESIAESLPGYDVRHLGWAVARPQYEAKLAEYGYEALEYLAEKDGETFLGYVAKDRLYKITAEDIAECLAE